MRMIIRTIAAALSVCLLFTHSIAGYAKAGDSFRAIDEYVSDYMNQNNIPGLALAVVRGSQVIYTQGYGIADPSGRKVTAQTPFILGSVSKMQTAMAVMLLIESGQVDLDTPVQQYIPWFSLRGEASKITVRHLLNHASGIPMNATENLISVDDQSSEALERTVRGLADIEMDSTPGSTYEYSNANYQVVGLLVQIVSGVPFEEFVENQLFAPLEMRHSYTTKALAQEDGMADGYRYFFGKALHSPNTPYPRAHFPSGFFISSAEDMAHVMIAHLNDGSYRGKQILSKKSNAILHRPYLQGYAMGWARDGDIISHTGAVSNFGSQVILDISRHMGVVVLFNINSAIHTNHLYYVAPSIMNLLNGQQPLLQSGIDQQYFLLLLVVVSSVILEIGWIAWSLKKMISMQKDPAKRLFRPIGVLIWIILPVLIEAGLYRLIMEAAGAGIPNALLFQPDLGPLLVLLLVCFGGWGILRSLWNLRLLLPWKVTI